MYISWLDSTPDKREVVGSSPTLSTKVEASRPRSSVGSERLPVTEKATSSSLVGVAKLF